MGTRWSVPSQTISPISFHFATDLSLMGNDAYNIGSFFPQSSFIKEGRNEGSKNAGIYDEINNWKFHRKTVNVQLLLLVHVFLYCACVDKNVDWNCASCTSVFVLWMWLFRLLIIWLYSYCMLLNPQ